MGNADDREMLEAARAEVVRLEQELAELRASDLAEFDGWVQKAVKADAQAEELLGLAQEFRARAERAEATIAAIREWANVERYKISGQHDTWTQWHEGVDSAQGEVLDILDAEKLARWLRDGPDLTVKGQ